MIPRIMGCTPFCSIQMPRMSFVPPAFARAGWQDTQRDVYRLVANEPFIADLHPDRIEEHQRVAGIERAALPLRDRLQHCVGDRRDQVGRHVDAVQLLQMSADLAYRHAACVHRHDLVVGPKATPEGR